MKFSTKENLVLILCLGNGKGCKNGLKYGPFGDL
jgi:hypothetical protein